MKYLAAMYHTVKRRNIKMNKTWFIRKRHVQLKEAEKTVTHGAWITQEC